MSVAPLTGLRVLDIATLYAAPLAATMLADFGADVIKVEPPEGDGFRGTKMWPVVARGKRSLVLDLRSDEGLAALRRLIVNADILVENLPPALAKRRGLDWATLSAINPRLVLLSVSCFGQDGPYGGRPGSGTIGEGFGGLTHMTGPAGGTPMLPSVALGDALGAMQAVIGTMMALHARDHHTGRGQQVDATLYEPVLTAIAQVFQFWQPGQGVPARNGSKMAAGTGLRNVYATAGGGFVAISASTARHAAELAALAGAKEGDDADAAVACWIATRPLPELVAELIERRIPVTPVNDLDALVTDPQVQARASLKRHDDPELGDVLLAGPAPRLAATPGRIGSINPPLDAAAASVWRDWGITEEFV
jgi:crotonobetainyl-CoA:carnitine CoA-transferase CaiB-like acyl-CoA transferase